MATNLDEGNSEFKPDKLCFKTDLVLHPVCEEWLVEFIYIYIYIYIYNDSKKI